MGADIRPQPMMLPDGMGGQRMAVLTAPPGRARWLVLHVPAFDEEMNLSRRAVARAARAMAQAGAAVLQLDLLGCGDSSGDLEDMNWPAWQDDLRRSAAWLQQRWPGLPLWLWAERAGAVLACDTLGPALPAKHLLLWQPTLGGQDLQRHWLRQLAASALARGQEGGPAMAAARQAWQAGERVLIAGYPVAAELVQATADLGLPPPATLPAGRLVWLDQNPRPRAEALPAQQAVLNAWQRAGWTVQHEALAGPTFWLGPEDADTSALTTRSVQALLEVDT